MAEESSRSARDDAGGRRIAETAPVATDEDAPAMDRLTDVVTPWAVRVAATLRLADSMAAGVTQVEGLAARSGADADALGRLLRFLAARGVFRETADGTFGLTGTAALLADNHPAGMRAWLDLEGFGGRMDRAMTGLLVAVRTGEPAYASVFGLTFWDDLAAHRAVAVSFDALMGSQAADIAPELLAATDWSGVRHVVDVGGGTGALLAAILRARPAVRGSLVDLPGAAEVARERFAEDGLTDRCAVIGQSFFDPLPVGGDRYLLSFVLRDWGGRDAAAILRRCADAAGQSGRVLIVERLLEPGDASATDHDLRMLVLTGGRERSLEAFRALAQAAGMAVTTAQRMPSGRSVLTCVAAGEASDDQDTTASTL